MSIFPLQVTVFLSNNMVNLEDYLMNFQIGSCVINLPILVYGKFLVPKTQIRKIYCSSTIITSKYVALLKLIRNVHMQIR